MFGDRFLSRHVVKVVTATQARSVDHKELRVGDFVGIRVRGLTLL
jgi:hypothetical protein